jgi:hypothetical protein
MTDTIISIGAMDEMAPDGPVSQSRLARLTLGYMTADAVMSADVFAEIMADSRGPYVALNEAVIALTESLVQAWTQNVDVEDVIPVVRGALLKLEGEVSA